MRKEGPCVKMEALNHEHSRAQIPSICLCPLLLAASAFAARSLVHLPRLLESTPLSAMESALGKCFQSTPWKWPMVT